MGVNKNKIHDAIDPTDSFVLKFLSFLYLLFKGIDASFPVYAPPFLCKIEAGKNVRIKKNSILKGEIRLDDGVSIGENSILDGRIYISKGTNLVRNNELIGKVQIGKYCAIARNVTFQGRNHFMHRAGIQARFYREVIGEKLGYISKGPIIVGNDAWIGTRAIILSGVKIGDGAIIGAGAVVTKDVQPYEIVGGVPAKHLKWRFPEHIRKQLLEIKWWDWDEEKIKRNKKFFMADLTKVDDLYQLIEE